MPENKADEMLNILPKACSNMGLKDEKFLFFFDPKIMDEKKFLFGLSLNTDLNCMNNMNYIHDLNHMNKMNDIHELLKVWYLLFRDNHDL